MKKRAPGVKLDLEDIKRIRSFVPSKKLNMTQFCNKHGYDRSYAYRLRKCAKNQIERSQERTSLVIRKVADLSLGYRNRGEKAFVKATTLQQQLRLKGSKESKRVLSARQARRVLKAARKSSGVSPVKRRLKRGPPNEEISEERLRSTNIYTSFCFSNS